MLCENLEVWKRSCRLCVDIYKFFHNCKDHGFKDQVTRASLSIPSNIAEGMEKDYPKEKSRFLQIAKGSAAELITQIYIGIEIEYIERVTGMNWIRELNELSKMIVALSKYQRSKE